MPSRKGMRHLGSNIEQRNLTKKAPIPWTHPHHPILYSLHKFLLQYEEKRPHNFQLPIVQVTRKTPIPMSPFPCSSHTSTTHASLAKTKACRVGKRSGFLPTPCMLLKLFFFFYKQRDKKLKLKHAKTRGAPYVHKQYTKKAKPKATKEGKKPIKEKVNQQSNHPTNSEKRDSPGPETIETTQEETEERGSSSSYLTSLPLGTFFDFGLPKYTKTDK